MNQKYSPEMRERALRMLEEAKPEHSNLMSALRHVAGLLGMSPETLRVWHRRREIDAGQRSDHGSNYLWVVYTDRINELGATPSTGSVGDSYDNALAEAVNGLYKTELIRRKGPWRTVEQVELATLEYVCWWNNARLHGEPDYRTPVEVEQAYYAGLEPAQPALAGQGHR